MPASTNAAMAFVPYFLHVSVQSRLPNRCTGQKTNPSSSKAMPALKVTFEVILFGERADGVTGKWRPEHEDGIDGAKQNGREKDPRRAGAGIERNGGGDAVADADALKNDENSEEIGLEDAPAKSDVHR